MVWFRIILAVNGGFVMGDQTDEIAFQRDGAIWVVDVDSGTERMLTDIHQYERPIVWSPHGRHLLFWKHSDVGWDIWRVDGNGGNPINLTHTTSGGCRSASYSPDGKRIAFMRDDPQGVFIMNADGSDQERLTDNGHRDVPPSWSPDGRALAYVDLTPVGERVVRIDMHVVDSSGKAHRQITNAEGSSDFPSWSPDGSLILFQASRGGNREICTIRPDGTDERNLTNTPDVNELTPVWSPDGMQLAFNARLGDRYELRVMKADGTGTHKLADLTGRPWPPVWSPSGRRLAFTSGERDASAVYVVDVTGENLRKIAEGGAWIPAWRPHAKVTPD